MEPKGESKNRTVSILPYGKTFLYIKNLENPHNKGIKNGYATMYDKNTLGWGTDVVSGPHRSLYKRAKAGKVTAKEARDLAVIDMRNHDKVIMENMKKYTSRPDTISLGPRLLMAQARYHYGNIIESFPEWGKAVATGDAKTQKKIALKLSKDYKDRYNRIKDIEIYPSKENGGIIKGQEGLSSEDLDNPVYKKGWSPKKELEQAKAVRESLQSDALKRFDKMAKTAYSTARLIPGEVGLATDIIDSGKNIYNIFKNGNGDVTVDFLRAIVNPISYKLTKTKKLLDSTAKYGADIVDDMGDVLFKGLKYTVNTTDQIQDSKELYNEINLKKQGGRFTFKRNRLVKNAESQNKKDMRKKFVKSDYPTYTNNKKKYQEGGELDPNIFVSWNNIPTSSIDIPEETPVWIPEYSSYKPSFTSTQTTKEEKKEENTDFYRNISKREESINTAIPVQGSEEFNKLYDEVVKEDPEAEEYRNFLTAVAKYESNFNSKAKNKYAPAWGFFQFMQDNGKYNNIGQYAGVDTQTFLNDPKLQIKAAIKLAKAMEKGFSEKDWENAKSKGISRWGMLGGAWLGGNGGLRKYLQNNINISDKHWSPNNSGIDMISQIKRYNF